MRAGHALAQPCRMIPKFRIRTDARRGGGGHFAGRPGFVSAWLVAGLSRRVRGRLSRILTVVLDHTRMVSIESGRRSRSQWLVREYSVSLPALSCHAELGGDASDGPMI